MKEHIHPEMAVFNAAIELPVSERPSYLQAACAGDVELVHRVNVLLDAHEAAGDFLTESAVATLAKPDDGSEDISDDKADASFLPLLEQIGDRIGRYNLVQPLGEGGCGVVYLAEQEFPVRRRVALKVIRLGMDTKSVIARFEAERQALALMDHPHIAKVLDAGTTQTGRPFFVMELVEGRPITEFCDENKLATRERLELFILVCQAIQHAHQKGVIHRDIKPSNILVAWHDGAARPVVIDFGIAKAMEDKLTEKTLVTARDQFIGTPAYMSPEQAGADAAGPDTRSDIYSLGVLLYELLTGRTPFVTKISGPGGLDEVRKIIREKEPQRPSTRLRQLADAALAEVARRRQAEPPRLLHAVCGDLDWIVMKCLEKDRTRRYETANGLVADLKRHLTNEPVAARPPSNLYRAQKMIRRHQLATAAVAAVLLALLLGLAATSYFYVQEREVLFHSLLAEAQARRTSGQMGQRLESLRAVEKAAAIHRNLDARNAAIAAMSMTDLRVAKLANKKWGVDPDPKVSYDRKLERYAQPNPDGSISIYSAEDDRLLFTLPSQGRPILKTSFSPDGRFLQAAGADNKSELVCALWDLESRKTVLDKYADLASFSEDSRLVLRTDTNLDVTITELTSGIERSRFSPGEPLDYCVLDATGTQIAGLISNHLAMIIFGAQAGKEALRIPLPAEGAGNPAWSPDGETLAVGCFDHNIYLFDSASGQLRDTLRGHWSPVPGVAFNHSGSLLKSHSWDDTVRLWHPFRGQQIMSIRANESLDAFSPDDHFFQVILNNQFGLVEVNESRECRDIRPAFTTQSLGAPVFDASGQVVASSTGERVWFWDAARGTKLGSFPTDYSDTAMFDRSNRWFVTTERNGLVKVRPVKATQNSLSVGPPRLLAHVEDPRWGALSLDGRHLAVPSHATGEVVVLDLQDPSACLVLGKHPLVDYVAISPDAHWVASGSWQNKLVTIWDVQTREIVKTLQMPARTQVAFSPDGRTLVTMSLDFQFWEVGSWKPQRAALPGSLIPQWNLLAFSPDSRILALTTQSTKIELLDTASGEKLATLEPAANIPITSLAFSPDGSHLACMTINEQIELWDLRLVRRELAAMNLDWDEPPYPPAPEGENSRPVTLKIDSGPTKEPTKP